MRKSADRAFLLTLGKDVHISDPRYSVNFQYPNNWRLTISAVQKEDRGQYVCEVNTHPPTMLVTNVTVLGNIYLFHLHLQIGPPEMNRFFPKNLTENRSGSSENAEYQKL